MVVEINSMVDFEIADLTAYHNANSPQEVSVVKICYGISPYDMHEILKSSKNEYGNYKYYFLFENEKGEVFNEYGSRQREEDYNF